MTEIQTKRCTKCHRELPATAEYFHHDKRWKAGLFSICRKCRNAQDRARRVRNGEHIRDIERKYREEHRDTVNRAALKHHFGMSLEAYVALLEKQHGVCAICGKPETRLVSGTVARLSVDHDHRTGKIRGLLCGKCNWMIGYSEDNPIVLRRAAEYLERDVPITISTERSGS